MFLWMGKDASDRLFLFSGPVLRRRGMCCGGPQRGCRRSALVGVEGVGGMSGSIINDAASSSSKSL